MKTNTFALKLMVALFAGSAMLAASLPAEAHGDRHSHREWRSDFRGPPGHAHARGQHRYQHPGHVVVRPPARGTVIVHQHHYHAPPPTRYGSLRHAPPHYVQRHYAPPRYAQPRHASPPRYYAPPPYVYHPAPIYTRDPSIVIGVNIPPIVIPIR